MKAQLLVLTLISLLLTGCGSGYWEIVSVDNSCYSCERPAPSTPVYEYAPIAVGDVRQFIAPQSGATVLVEIVGTTYRDDGQRVFIERTTWGTDFQHPETAYLYQTAGYLVYTSLEALTDADGYDLYPQNPFAEQRVATNYPRDGASWKDIPGDPAALWWKSQYFGDYQTAAYFFSDVFRFNRQASCGTYQAISVYYAPEVGWIVTEDLCTQEIIYGLQFAQVGSFIYGERLAAHDNGLSKAVAKSTRIHPLGRRTTTSANK